jgi:hypothetical protein
MLLTPTSQVSGGNGAARQGDGIRRLALALVAAVALSVIWASVGVARAMSLQSVYTITYEAGPDGWVDGVSPQSSATGFSAVTAVPDAGYHFASWSDGSTDNPRTDTAPSRNVAVLANFVDDSGGGGGTPGPWRIAFVAGSGGSITGTKVQTIRDGANASPVTAVPAEGHHFTKWTGAGTFSTTQNPFTVGNAGANATFTANFAVYTHTLSYTAGLGGSISGPAAQTIDYGASGATVTAVPDAGQDFKKWSDGLLTAARQDAGVTSDLSVMAVFAPHQYTLTYIAGAGGSITGYTNQTVLYQQSGMPVVATPALGWHFANWSDDHALPTRFDFNVRANITATAYFAFGANACDDTYTVYSRPTSLTVLANDDQGVGDLASYTQPSNGVVTGSGLRSLLYTPDSGYIGQDVFTYTAQSGATATVTIQVQPNVTAPKTVQVAKVTTHTVNVSWSAPVSFGSGFASFTVAWRAAGTSTWTVCAPITASTTLHQFVTDDAIVPGSGYEFTVSARDSGGYVATSGPVPLGVDVVTVAGFILPVVTRAQQPATLTVSGLDAGASASLGADAADTPGVSSVSIDGCTITVVPAAGFTGVIELPVSVSQGGNTGALAALVTVLPLAPASPTFGIISKTATRVSWTPTAGVTGYRVYVGGSLVATAGSADTSVTVGRFLGPKSLVTVQATGADDTRSNVVSATYRPLTKVTAALVTFSGTSAKLSSTAKKTLVSTAKLMKSLGFSTAWLDAYPGTGAKTTAAKKKLAAARVAAVKAYLTVQFKALRVKVAFKTVYWTSAHSVYMTSKYRRAEVALQ